MRTSTFFAVLSSIAAAVALPQEFNTTIVPRLCASDISAAKIAAMEKQLTPRVFSTPNKVFIQVYWNVIAAGHTPAEGFLSDRQISDSMGVLNQDFSNTSIVWHLAGVQRTLNKAWFNALPYSKDHHEMKRQLHHPDESTLNLYTVGFQNGSSVLGHSTSPYEYKSYPRLDGVAVSHTTLPGGSNLAFNLGHTLTHEVGHWVGLLHTFEGGCSGNGDLVDDTPAEASAGKGCPVGRDSCPGAGVDPIHNFMDTTDDRCRNQFTPGQVTRMHTMLRNFRNVKI